MKLLDNITRRLGYTPQAEVEAAMAATNQRVEAAMAATNQRVEVVIAENKKAMAESLQLREFAAALQNRLTNDWNVSVTTADMDIRTGLKNTRARSRDLENNDDYAAKYFKMLENNVLGANGIGLQMKVRESVRKGTKFVEQYDTRANDIIETHWQRWNRKEFFTISKQLCGLDVQNLCIRSVARDGAIFIRKHYPQENPYKFAIELIEADQLDTDMSATMSGGVVRLGVEYDLSGAAVAYHILRHHPGEMYQTIPGKPGMWRERVPASQMIQLFVPSRVGQSTGMPWMASGMSVLKLLNGYAEAECTAARAGASKFGSYENIPGMPGAEFKGATDSQGNRQTTFAPGTIEEAPYGKTLKLLDPTHPTTAYGEFMKSNIRKFAAGRGVSYMGLGNDAADANYSSMRGALLEEREEWMKIQRWFINWFMQPIFEEWLKMSLAVGALTDNGQSLPAVKFDKFNSPEWKPRRWPWVDPLADLQADVLAVEKGFKSRRDIVSESGGDIEDLFKDLQADEDLAEEHGLDFDKESSQQANSQQSKPDAPDDSAPKKAKVPSE